MKEQFAARRIVNLVLIFAATIAFGTVSVFLSGFYLDMVFGVFSVTVLFFVLFLFLLEQERGQKKIAGNRETDFSGIVTGFAMAAVLTLCFFALPEFSCPVMVLSFTLSAVGTDKIAFCAAMYFCTVFEIAHQCNEYEMFAYTMLVLFGCIISDMLERKRVKLWCSVLIIALSIVIPVIFSYYGSKEMNWMILLKGACAGAFTVLFSITVYPWLLKQRTEEINHFLADITDEDFYLARELRNFSRQEYRHALRVSRMSEKCAVLLHADAAVCKAAGFYYRIGILDGDPMVENGVIRAKASCFPEKVTEILSEYYGMEKLPSTIESAIVQIVDGMIKKLEALEHTQTIENGWNKEMIIYQTLNDYSAQGLYDESGLSMNMFLKIREYLVKEEALQL